MEKEMFINRNNLILTVFILLSVMLASCGGGGGGSSEPIADISGTWDISEKGTSNCYGEEFYQDSYQLTVTQSGNSLTVSAPAGIFTGTISGSNVSWKGSYAEDQGVTTINNLSLTATADGNSVSGSASWSWTDGVESCSGTTDTITGTRVPGTGPTTPTNGGATQVQALDFFESDMAHKWRRFHAYDGSSRYYVFKSDRTGCYFEYSSSSSRVDNTNYSHWELQSIGNNVFNILVRGASGGSIYSIGEFHYVDNEIWRGGYSNLNMTPSTTSRDCN